MVNNGALWIDNIHLKIARDRANPIFPLIRLGEAGAAADGAITPSNVYITNVTFQAENRGTATAVFTEMNYMAVFLDGACSERVLGNSHAFGAWATVICHVCM